MEKDAYLNNDELNKIEIINNKLKEYSPYFTQNLINKDEEKWTLDELWCYFYYFKFRLYNISVEKNGIYKIAYFQSAINIFKKIYTELMNITNITIYDKICAIVSLYNRFITDYENEENKHCIIGHYILLNLKDNKNICYNMVKEFIINIIDNLTEKSFIFLPLLQINSGFKEDINSDDKKQIFGLSLLNVDMLKRRLKLLLPNLIFIIRHPSISSKRGSIYKPTGNIFIYETSIFGRVNIDNIINNQPKDAAIAISFVILHEIFMHKAIRSIND